MNMDKGPDRSAAGRSPAIVPHTRRRRRPSLGHDEFLDRALDLFLEQGFERTSIESITASIGMAKRTVYLRYGDKASLFKAALERAIEDWVVPVERLREVETGDLEGSLLAIGQILVDNILSPAGLRLLRLTNAVSSHMPEIGAFSVEQGTNRTLGYLADLFHRLLGLSDERLGEAEDAAEAFLHLVVGGPANAAAWGVTRDKAAIDRRVRYSVRVFLHGLAAAEDVPSCTDALEAEKSRLRSLLADTMVQLDAVLKQVEVGKPNEGALSSALTPTASPIPRRRWTAAKA